MTLRNTAARYGNPSKLFHWATALGIAIMIPLGLIAHNLPASTDPQIATKTWLFSLHKTVGVTVFAIALLRIMWALTQTKPDALHPNRRFEHAAADTVHWVLYGALVLVPLSGWVQHAAADGFAPIWWPFGQDLPFVPKSTTLAMGAATAHGILNLVLGGALALHVAGALKHHIIDKDATLRRMLPGHIPGHTHDTAATPHTRPTRTWPPIAAALVIWSVAIGFSIAQMLRAPQTAPALTQVASEWQVDTGEVGLTIRQMGAEVTGRFADWTAAISFAERQPPEQADPIQAGHVDVIIAIGSLSLGSVTDMALGGDYLDVTGFPVARFAGPILRSAQGNYYVEGTLSLRGGDVALPLPFDIAITQTERGPQATVTGSVTLDRMAFGIGAGVTDTNQLAHEVIVTLALTATAAP
ncbi:MAG: cytochrome b/b6 domain-containing protein, partial [Paracoccaceae bacterium]